jgi:amidase
MVPVSDEDLLRLDAGHFLDQFDKGTLTVAALPSQVVQQIEDENIKGLSLRAIIFMALESQLRERAQLLDQEKRSGRSRGPLHGVPVVLKVT